MIGYHELTMNEPRNQRSSTWRQIQVMTVVTVAVLAYSVITSGALKRLEIQRGSFPGGEYVYKFTNRDYAAAMSLSRSIVEDLGFDSEQEWKENLTYSIYLDDPLRTSGRHQRFASGILIVDKQQHQQQWKKMLLKKNEQIVKPLLPNEKQHEVDVQDLWPRLPYQATSLPNNVPAAVVTFPFTNGVASALVQTYKIFPQLLKYAAEHGEKGIKPVVVSTCSIELQMCIHYSPLEKTSKFLLGNPDTDVYLKDVCTEPEWYHWSSLSKAIPFTSTQ